jgi:hypothetical protein
MSHQPPAFKIADGTWARMLMCPTCKRANRPAGSRGAGECPMCAAARQGSPAPLRVRMEGITYINPSPNGRLSPQIQFRPRHRRRRRRRGGAGGASRVPEASRTAEPKRSRRDWAEPNRTVWLRVPATSPSLGSNSIRRQSPFLR